MQSEVQVKLGKYVCTCEVVSTRATRGMGLRGRLHLAEDRGMLFAHDGVQYVEIHMDGMSIPLDVVFVGEDSTVKKIVENLEPESSPVDCDACAAVIEMPAGICQKYKIKVGQRVELATRD